MIIFLVGLFSSMIVAFLITPRIRDFLKSVQLGDKPDSYRKMHTSIVPNLGGIGIFLSFLLGIAAVSIYSIDFYKYISQNYLWFFLAISLILIVGILDDVYDISFKQKFLVQIATASLVVVMDELTVNIIREPLFGNLIFLNDQASLVFSVLWIVAISNAINLIDGMDGLAGGASVIACAVMGLISFVYGDFYLGVVYAILIGSILGFLRYNFNPASIFMGDTGSLFIGFTIGYLTLNSRQTFDTSFGIFIPFLALMFPIVDTVLAPLRRVISGQHPFKGDRSHIHHRIMDRLGFSHKKTVICVYLISLFHGAIAIVSVYTHFGFLFVGFIISHGLMLAILYKLGYTKDLKRTLAFLGLKYRRNRMVKK